MAKKSFEFASRVNYLATALVAAVLNILFVACESYEMERSEDITSEYKVAPKKQEMPQAQPALSFSFLRVDSTAAGKTFSTEWISSENTTGTKVMGKLSVATSHENDGNAVPENELNKVIDLEYARQHTTHGELKSYIQQYGGTTHSDYAGRVVAQLGDGGTLMVLDGSNTIECAVVRDTTRHFPCDSILWSQIQLKSLSFVEKNVTRAAETFVDKTDPRYVAGLWDVPCAHLDQDGKVVYTYNVEVSDTVLFFPIKKNDIAEVKTDTMRVMLDPSIFNCIVKHEFTYKNGEKGKSEKSATIKCSLTAKPEWSEKVSSTAFTYDSAEPVIKGSAYIVSNADGVKTLEREDVFTTVQTNGSEVIKTPYTFKHQSVTISDEFGAYTFDFIEPAFKQVSTKVEKVSESATLEVARLRNTVEVSYLGGRQTGEETVLLNREIEEYLVSDVLDINSAKKITLDDKIIFQIDKLKKYSTGREVRETVILEVARGAKVGDPFTAIELNSNYHTGNYELKTINSDKVVKTIKDVTFTVYVREKKGTAEVKLNGSTQKNIFFVTEAEECTVSYNGRTYSFDADEVSVKHNDSLTGGAEVSGYKVYNYADKVVYTFNGNVKNLTPTGTIKVKVEEPKTEEPEGPKFADFGGVKLVRQTTTLNETGNGYVYVLSVQFFNNKVLPGLVQPGSTKIEWLYDKVELVEGSNDYNSVVYTSEGWVNCTAKDVYTKDYMKWSCGKTEVKRLTFDDAQSLNWDRGFTREDNGKSHLTVFTNRFNLNVSNGKLYVTDTFSGSNLNVYGK